MLGCRAKLGGSWSQDLSSASPTFQGAETYVWFGVCDLFMSPPPPSSWTLPSQNPGQLQMPCGLCRREPQPKQPGMGGGCRGKRPGRAGQGRGEAGLESHLSQTWDRSQGSLSFLVCLVCQVGLPACPMEGSSALAGVLPSRQGCEDFGGKFWKDEQLRQRWGSGHRVQSRQGGPSTALSWPSGPHSWEGCPGIFWPVPVQKSQAASRVNHQESRRVGVTVERQGRPQPQTLLREWMPVDS